MSLGTEAKKKAMEIIEGLGLEGEALANVKSAVDVFSMSINKEAQGVREGFDAKLGTESQTVSNLQTTIADLKNELANKGDDTQVNARILELEAEVKQHKGDSETYKTQLLDLNNKLHFEGAQKAAREILKAHNADTHDFVVEDLARTLKQGEADKNSWFHVDENGEYTPAETRANQLMETKYKVLQVAKGAETGGTGEAGATSSASTGLPKNRDEYMKLPAEQRDKLINDGHGAHIKEILQK